MHVEKGKEEEGQGVLLFLLITMLRMNTHDSICIIYDADGQLLHCNNNNQPSFFFPFFFENNNKILLLCCVYIILHFK